MKKNVAIIGIGEVPTGRFPEQSAISFALESSMQAISHSGLKKDDIDRKVVYQSFTSCTIVRRRACCCLAKVRRV